MFVNSHQLLNQPIEPVKLKPQVSFAKMLRNNLGEEKWEKLHSDIQNRFLPCNESGEKLTYQGNMEWVYCSPLGWLIATLLKPLSVLPTHRCQNINFAFDIKPDTNELLKSRKYQFDLGKVFTFLSKFRETPFLHEEFKGNLGMKLKLEENNGDLIFKDKGYFLRIGSFRVPIPAFLCIGHFALLHRNISLHRFQVIIKITHPLFGTLFYQRGEFYDSI